MLDHLLALRVTPANADDRSAVAALAEAVQDATNGNVDLAYVIGNVSASILIEVFRFGWVYTLFANNDDSKFTIDKNDSVCLSNAYIATGVGYYTL